MLLEAAPDAVFVCVPPYAAPTMCRLLVDRGIPFLVEKPVAALDDNAACELAKDIESQGLVAAVGYQLRGLDYLDQVRDAIRLHPPPLVVARWLGGTPSSTWWLKPEMSGGQVIEQMTHFYDLTRYLLGEPRVVLAASRQGADGEVALATTALLRFDAGALGAFVNTRVAEQPLIELELTSAATIGLTPEREWTLALPGHPPIATRRSPYAVQAEAFLDAVETNDPARVLATFREGLATFQLTRAVVAAAGSA
jgi:myo-inositol 2-dehydrogenase / D-chiro-inositol 1-dehydrogenase